MLAHSLPMKSRKGLAHDVIGTWPPMPSLVHDVRRYSLPDTKWQSSQLCFHISNIGVNKLDYGLTPPPTPPPHKKKNCLECIFYTIPIYRAHGASSSPEVPLRESSSQFHVQQLHTTITEKKSERKKKSKRKKKSCTPQELKAHTSIVSFLWQKCCTVIQCWLIFNICRTHTHRLLLNNNKNLHPQNVLVVFEVQCSEVNNDCTLQTLYQDK